MHDMTMLFDTTLNYQDFISKIKESCTTHDFFQHIKNLISKYKNESLTQIYFNEPIKSFVEYILINLSSSNKVELPITFEEDMLKYKSDIEKILVSELLVDFPF